MGRTYLIDWHWEKLYTFGDFTFSEDCEETKQQDATGCNEHDQVALDILEKGVPDNQKERRSYPKSRLPLPSMALS